eukprot:12070913-Ditylum_brightwellii.AAC.1
MIVPFLKGVHLALDSWHPGCDEEEEAQEVVYDVPCLEKDLRVLAALGESDTPPPLCLVRGCAIDQVMYGFGDAPGLRFGLTFTSTHGVRYQTGI